MGLGLDLDDVSRAYQNRVGPVTRSWVGLCGCGRWWVWRA